MRVQAPGATASILAVTLIPVVLGAQDVPSRRPTAFVDVSVVSLTGSGILPRRTVLVREGMVSAVGDRQEVEIPGDALRIDGHGRYLIPGLVDAHVHLMEEGDLARFLFYGVTTVRHLTGSLETLRWRGAVADGSIPGPRIVTSGPLFAGPEIPWNDKVVPGDAEAARAEVRRERDAGYDLVKVYDGISADVHRAVTDEAARLGLAVTGHIPEAVGLEGVLRAGQDLEHTDKLVFDVWGHDLDPSRIDEVAWEVADAGVFLTPTLASMEQLARIRSGGFDSLLARPEARRVGPETLSFWCRVSSRLRADRTPGPGVRVDPFTDFQIRVVGALHRAGVPLLAGTDYPNAVLAPGSGLLEELRALARAGLTPQEALRAATRTAARAIGDPTSGAVRPVARADLVLLRENPLRDLRALDVRDGVMAAGRWFPRAELDRLVPGREVPPACAPEPRRRGGPPTP